MASLKIDVSHMFLQYLFDKPGGYYDPVKTSF